MTGNRIQAAERLVGALGDLLLREAVAARSGRGSRVRAVQARIRPVVAALSALARESPQPRLAGAISSLVERRRQNQLLMKAALVRLREQIDTRSRALGRLQRVSPLYARRRAVASRLNVST
jgi:hypothetical protein